MSYITRAECSLLSLSKIRVSGAQFACHSGYLQAQADRQVSYNQLVNMGKLYISSGYFVVKNISPFESTLMMNACDWSILMTYEKHDFWSFVIS